MRAGRAERLRDVSFGWRFPASERGWSSGHATYGPVLVVRGAAGFRFSGIAARVWWREAQPPSASAGCSYPKTRAGRAAMLEACRPFHAPVISLLRPEGSVTSAIPSPGRRGQCLGVGKRGIGELVRPVPRSRPGRRYAARLMHRLAAAGWHRIGSSGRRAFAVNIEATAWKQATARWVTFAVHMAIPCRRTPRRSGPGEPTVAAWSPGVGRSTGGQR